MVHRRGSVPQVSPALIGHRASVGSSVSHADWSRVNGAVDKLPGGVWIDYIGQGLEDGQSIVAVPVTGSLVSSTLFCCRDVTCIARSSLNWSVCGTDWVLPAGYQVLLQEIAECWTMDADGFSVVEIMRVSHLGWNCMSHGMRRRQWWVFRRLVRCRCGTATWSWPSYGGAQCRGVPSGRACLRT